MASAAEKMIRSVVGKGIGKVADLGRKRLPKDIRNPFLTGIHTPMTEEVTLTDIEVIGEIPKALNGRYLRNGPNPIDQPHPGSYHWFVGDAMVHGIRLSGGEAKWYRNRWVRSKKVSEALGEAPKPGRRLDAFDSPNTNVIGHGGRYWAIVEGGGMPVELSGDLETLSHNDFDGTLTHSFSAHPHIDPATGHAHAVCYVGPDPATIRHVVLDENAKVVRQEPIPVSDGPMVHDCAITENYVLVFDLPVTLSLKTLMKGYAFPYRWNESHPARVGLLRKDGKGSNTIWCEVDPCYSYHMSNARELADGSVVVDLAVHDTMFADRHDGPDSRHSKLERWTINPKTARVNREVIDERNHEFPRYDERRTGAACRFTYTVGLPEKMGGENEFSGNALYKHDVERGTAEVHDFGPGCVPGEFVFVPREGSTTEDDGWVMGLVVDREADRTELAILNADDFTAPPQARIRLPHRVPPGFHGNWIPD